MNKPRYKLKRAHAIEIGDRVSMVAYHHRQDCEVNRVRTCNSDIDFRLHSRAGANLYRCENPMAYLPVRIN